jgi:hypothetical protein
VRRSSLRTANRHPGVFRTLIAHEPPLFPLLAGTYFEPALAEVQRRVGAVVELLENGDEEGAARLFVDTAAFGPDAWKERLTPEMRQVFVEMRRRFWTSRGTRIFCRWISTRSPASAGRRC